jgi:hypothetical protein
MSLSGSRWSGIKEGIPGGEGCGTLRRVNAFWFQNFAAHAVAGLEKAEYGATLQFVAGIVLCSLTTRAVNPFT